MQSIACTHLHTKQKFWRIQKIVLTTFVLKMCSYRYSFNFVLVHLFTKNSYPPTKYYHTCYFTSPSLELSVMLCHNSYFYLSLFMSFSFTPFFLGFFSFCLNKLIHTTREHIHVHYMGFYVMWKKEIFQWNGKKNYTWKMYIYKSFVSLSSILCYKKHNFYILIFM